MKKINVVIFGATGSIGKSTLSIIARNKRLINVEGITCNKNLRKLIKIAELYNVKKIGYNEKSVKNQKKYNLENYRVFQDLSDFNNIISKKTDIVLLQ